MELTLKFNDEDLKDIENHPLFEYLMNKKKDTPAKKAKKPKAKKYEEEEFNDVLNEMHNQLAQALDLGDGGKQAMKDLNAMLKEEFGIASVAAIKTAEYSKVGVFLEAKLC